MGGSATAGRGFLCLPLFPKVALIQGSSPAAKGKGIICQSGLLSGGNGPGGQKGAAGTPEVLSCSPAWLSFRALAMPGALLSQPTSIFAEPGEGRLWIPMPLQLCQGSRSCFYLNGIICSDSSSLRAEDSAQAAGGKRRHWWRKEPMGMGASSKAFCPLNHVHPSEATAHGAQCSLGSESKQPGTEQCPCRACAACTKPSARPPCPCQPGVTQVPVPAAPGLLSLWLAAPASACPSSLQQRDLGAALPVRAAPR